MPEASVLRAFAHESITVDATVGGVTLTFTNVLSTPPAKSAELTVETAPIRWTSDGTAPTSTVGHTANPTDALTLTSPSELWNFRAIRTGATSGNLRVTYYR